LPPTPFSLVKWYMDCVTEPGTTAILYCAEICWRSVKASYSSILLADGNTVSTQTSMTRHRLDSDSGAGKIDVEFPALDVIGTWTAATPPVQHTMFEDSRGSVLWNCLQPSSSVSLHVGGRELTGLGYAECLTLTIPPWQLPMRQLRWGRFVSAQDSLAWIDWQGPYSTSLAVHNGRKCETRSISESEIVLEDATLRMNQPLTLRSGALASTILPSAPFLRSLLPRSLFNIAEKKWRGRGSLETNGHQSLGWVIHEVVDWNC